MHQNMDLESSIYVPPFFNLSRLRIVAHLDLVTHGDP